MRIAYFDTFSGISGDMAIAAFLDAGLSFAVLSKELARLKVKGYKLKKSKVRRNGIAATKFDVILHHQEHGHRTLKEIIAIIDKSSLNFRVKVIAKDIFNNIGRAEAKVHGIREKNIRFHEVGDLDSIVDIVGIAIAIDRMGIDLVYSSVVTQGRTLVFTKHGLLPIPGPATLELLKGIPTKISNIEAELVTPTGAGIIKTLAKRFGPMPQMKIGRIGYGAGTVELKEIPNMLRVTIGDSSESFKEDKILIIETNIDDMNPQIFEYLFERLFKAGALDVYTTHIQMKKTRPAYKVTILAEPSKLKDLSKIIFEETSTIGIRFYEAGRFILDRKVIKVKTKYGKVRVKVSSGPGGIMSIKPEYEDCLRLSRSRNIPLKNLYDETLYEKHSKSYY